MEISNAKMRINSVRFIDVETSARHGKRQYAAVFLNANRPVSVLI